MDERPIDVLQVLNYYSPYVSGVTEYARMVAEGLASRGHRVVVVAGHHDPATPAREILNGVEVVRTGVVARIGKGIISPSFVPTAVRLAQRARMTLLNAPMLEAGAIALAVPREHLVTLYQCDVSMPPGAFNAFQSAVLDASHRTALRRSARIAVTTADYAEHSRLHGAMRGRFTPVSAPALDRGPGAASFRDGDGLHVGFLGRIVEEKGLEYLVQGFRELGPDARLLIGGDFAQVAGGSVVDRVRAAIDGDPRVRLLGFLTDEHLADFYASLDVFALPSINSFEAFGIVQVEAMLRGVRVVASDLPGVRIPVQRSGHGRIVPPRDAAAITRALRELTVEGAAAGVDSFAREECTPDIVVARFEEILGSLGAAPHGVWPHAGRRRQTRSGAR
ncbi:glycosyltransferase family 4 protein [Actinotalea sp. K2]|uniref:glycosyltransferase family 4 protein n=1 Tax=Actinotalea sp. K2 TaxID=2939438 RepID=UPI002016D5DD|nr:glycosyltransferase family 4 protein [Actinotalea sp. K2]MCL3862728.1 glycosyltransferase family 4 protein [Actinotalea sp. K2]